MSRKRQGADRFAAGGAVDRYVEAFVALADTLPGQKLADYRIGEVLRQSSMSQTYECFRADGNIGRTRTVDVVFSKPLSESELEAFLNRHRLLASLDHPVLASTVSAGVTVDGYRFVIGDMVDGVGIDRYCDIAELPLNERLSLCGLVLGGVEYLHRKGIVHGNLHSSTVLVDRVGQPAVLRAGFSDLFGDVLGDEPDQLASPERLLGLKLQPSSDIYQLGLLLASVLSGEPVVRSIRRSVAIARAAENRRVELSEEGLARLPEELRGLILSCLEPKPDERPTCVGDLRSGLARFVTRI